MVAAFLAFVCFVFGCDTSFRLHQPIHLVLNASAKLHVLPHSSSHQQTAFRSQFFSHCSQDCSLYLASRFLGLHLCFRFLLFLSASNSASTKLASSATPALLTRHRAACSMLLILLVTLPPLALQLHIIMP